MGTCIVAIAAALCLAGGKAEPLENKAPQCKCIAISSVYAITCQYGTLNHMSFLEQTPGESFMMMPVMTYCAVKATSWATGIALVVTGSVTKCLMTDPISSHSDTANVSYGLLLLLGCIFMDLHFHIPAGNLKAMSSRYWAPPRSCRARSSL